MPWKQAATLRTEVEAPAGSPSWANALLVIVAASVLVSGLLTILVNAQHRMLVAVWDERESSVADSRARRVSDWLQERKGDAEVISRSPQIADYLSRVASHPLRYKPSADGLLPHAAALDSTKDSYRYWGVYVVDRHGRVVSQATGSPTSSTLLESAALRAMQNGRFQIEFFVERSNGGSLCFTSPVDAIGDNIAAGQRMTNPLGAVVLIVNPHEKLFPLLAEETVMTKSGETVLMTWSGSEIAYLSPLRAAPFGFHVTSNRPTLAASAALAGRQMFGEFIDYRGVAVLAATRSIPMAGWGLVSKIDRREAFAEFRRDVWVETGIAALLVVALAGWLFGYRRYVCARFLKLRQDEFRSLLESTPDGLVVLNTTRHIVFVNSRTERLFGYRREELLGQSFTVLVPEQTVESASGVEAWGRHKDGVAFPVELGFNPVVSSKGRLVCAAIRDLTERKRIEGELKRTEDEYGVLFNSGNDAMFVLEVDEDFVGNNIIQANEICCERLGYTREELLRLSIRDLYAPGKFEVLASLRKSLVTLRHCLFETEHLARDGRSIPTEVNARIIEFRGKPAVLAVARDITERKTVEAALQASERKYRRYIERNAASFFHSTLDGQLLECNDAMVRLLGHESQEELKTRGMADLYLNIAERQAVMDILKAQVVLNNREVCLMRKDGSSIWALVNLTLVPDEGGEASIEGTAIDITELKRIEKELRTIASVVDASTDFIGFASLEGEVRFVNPAGRRILGLSKDLPITGLRIMEFTAEQNREDMLQRVLPLALREGHWAGENQFKHLKTGAAIPMWQSLFFITDPQTGERTGMATICRDLTQRKQEQQELQAAKEAADAGNRAKSRFLANMSHEIRTPMNGILGMTRLLLATALAPEQRHCAELALSSGENLLSVVNSILDLSKIEAGKVVLENVDFQLNQILENVTEPLAIAARSKGLKFTCVVDPAVPLFPRGDSVRLQQVIGNLVSNAVKFTSQGSVNVRVELAGRDERTATLRFTVTDTGVGVSKTQASTLFSPFVQGDESTTRKFGGTGLGLSISKQLVELMGGQIGFESESGRGSCVWFTAVMQTQPRSSAAPIRPRVIVSATPETAALGIKSARILLAEDHPINRQVMLGLLKQLGYGADPVGNGYEAVEALRSGDYDLVFMDCQMPEMDGYEATRLIRDAAIGARNPRIPIVAVTAGAMAGDKQRCIDAGMDDYISKPIEPDKLARTLDKWLSRNEAAEPAVPAEVPALAVFDREGLLKRLMGNKGLADRVMDAFLEAAPAQLLNLRGQLAGQDAPGILREAHSLKGAAATVSAPGLRSLAVEAEDAAKAGEWSRMAAILPRMEDQLDQLRAAVAEPIPT